MKLFKIVLSLSLLVCLSVQAQIKVDVNVGTPAVTPPQVIISPPAWGPAVTTEQYYYLPDIETYYDLKSSQYVYMNNGTWVRSRNVPSRFRNYNFNNGRVIVINDYRGRSPYVKFKNHKVKYMKSKNFNGKVYSNNVKHNNNGKHGNNGNGKNKNK